jgi:DNA invertase Pin-like site-specific DNA recombinase
MIYGYARVSSDGRNVAAQAAALTAAGVEKVFRETASGDKAARVQLRRVLDRLDADEVLMMTRLGRLAPSTRDLLNTLATIADRKACCRSLGDAWAEAIAAHGRLMVTMLGGLDEFERELNRAQTSEGHVRAVARGGQLGPKFKPTTHERKEAAARKANGEPVCEIARSYDVGPATISRLTP